MKKIKGLIAAPYTPFDNVGRINLALIGPYADYLKRSGVSGVFVNGTTGEGVSLTVEERLALAKAWVEQKSTGLKVIIHVGHNSLGVCRQLAEQAQAIGADGTGAMAPNFFKPADLTALVSYNAAIADAAPALPYYYYHIPVMTGAHFSMIDFLQQAEGQIPNLAGVKFSDEDLMDMKLCLEYAEGKFDILHGRDEILICGLLLGVQGAIGSTYNYIAPLFVRLIEAFEAGDLPLANELQLTAMKIIKVLIKYGGAIKAGKSIMRLAGLEFGRPRLPARGLTPGEEKELEKELTALRFQEHTVG